MGLSRNKVAVPEGAAGSPPFYGEFRARFVSGVCPMRVERFHGPVWGCWCGRDHRLAVPLGMAGVVWVCFWVPGPPPHGGFHCGAVRCPCGVAGVRWTRGGTCGAWRFENWIVDASKRNMVFLFAYRDFAKLFFLSLVSRSIVL